MVLGVGRLAWEMLRLWRSSCELCCCQAPSSTEALQMQPLTQVTSAASASFQKHIF